MCPGDTSKKPESDGLTARIARTLALANARRAKASGVAREAAAAVAARLDGEAEARSKAEARMWDAQRRAAGRRKKPTQDDL